MPEMNEQIPKAAHAQPMTVKLPGLALQEFSGDPTLWKSVSSQQFTIRTYPKSKNPATFCPAPKETLYGSSRLWSYHWKSLDCSRTPNEKILGFVNNKEGTAQYWANMRHSAKMLSIEIMKSLIKRSSSWVINEVYQEKEWEPNRSVKILRDCLKCWSRAEI